jgi:hypothetical protein
MKTIAQIAAALFMGTMIASAPAEAGGWGRGPSWGQARKIVNQAGKDIANGAKAATKPPIPAIAAGAAVVGICVATSGACAIAF